MIIVGAGLGGLALALRLAHRGCRVTVLEKTDQVGGRCRQVRVGECTFDGGPTLLMMLDPFFKLFRDVGERLEDHVPIRLCEPSYRVFWRDGSTLDGTPNVAKMVRQIEALAGPDEALKYPGLLGELGALYRDAVPMFVRRNYDSPLALGTPRSLATVLRHGMLGNLAQRIERRFDDPRLRMLFSFQTMYLGLSPYDSPWVYAVLTYMEYGEGIWYPEGGLSAIPRAVARLAQARGAEIRLETPVARIEGKRVVLESGEELTGDAVVANADLPYAQRELLGRKTKPKKSSCSAAMLYLDYEGELEGLLHHNVFFGQDFRGNLDAIFAEPPRVPEDPAFYVCLSGRTDPSMAPAGRENLYVLIPCPNLDRPMTEAETRRLHGVVYERLGCVAGFDPGRVRARQSFGPEGWQSLLNLDRGAAFGLSHVFGQSACFRPSNVDRQNPDLLYVGASTTPGNGLPMVLISAELAEERLERRSLLS